MQFNLLKSLVLAGAFFVVAAPREANAQYALDYGFAFGTGNYLGDIGGEELTRRDFAADLHYDATKLSTHAFVRYRLNGAIAVRAQVGTTYIEDSDALSTNPARRTRNAHFQNWIKEVSLRGEVNLFSRSMITRYTSKVRMGFNSYATLGVTGFAHAPKAQIDALAAQYHYEQGNIQSTTGLDYDRWYDLRDAKTENNTYGLVSLGVPLGLGASFIVNYQYRVGLEFIWNLTFTDYLDDVSDTYANPETFAEASYAYSSAEGICLSQPGYADLAASVGVVDPVRFMDNFRWDPAYSSPRGNPDKNDSYGSLQVTVSKVVRQSSNFRRNNYYSKRKSVKRRGNRKPGSRNMGRGRAKF